MNLGIQSASLCKKYADPMLSWTPKIFTVRAQRSAIHLRSYFKRVSYSEQEGLEAFFECWDKDYKINHNQLVVKAPLKQCETLACTLEQLASGHLTKLKNHESDSTEDRIDHYRVTLSDQMHHICDKYHLFVLEQRPFKKDAEAVKCLDQRVFSLLVVQPPVFYAKRFLRIGSCYKQMSAYFDHIGCGLAITSSYEAQKAYKEALEIAEELVPKNLVQCFEISISIAETMEFGRRRDKAYTYLENVQPANNHNLDDLAKTISEARAKVGEWKRANRVSPRRVPLVIDSGAP